MLGVVEYPQNLPKALIRACNEELFQYQCRLRTAEIVTFTKADYMGGDFVVLYATTGGYLQGGSLIPIDDFPAVLDVKVVDIVWCAVGDPQ